MATDPVTGRESVQTQPLTNPAPPTTPGGGPPLMTKAVASAICGMVSICICFCGGIPSVILGSIAIWLGVWVRKHYRGTTASEMANVASWIGTIAGAIGIILGLIAFLFWILTGSVSIISGMQGNY